MSASERITRILRPSHRLSVAASFRDALVASGFDDAERFRALLESAPSIAGGRSPQRRIALPESDAVLRLRPARHGGLFGGFLADRYLSPAGIERELALWVELRERGLPLPPPVAAVASRQRGFWRCHLAALECTRAPDGLAWLASGPGPERLARVATAFARSLRALHDAGIVHGDLHLRNLLVEEDGEAVRCLFVDLDRARRHPAVSPARRLAELARLSRSLEKLHLADRVDRRLRARVIAAYCDADLALWRAMRRARRRSRARERLRLAGHRLAWRAGRIVTRRAPHALAFGLVALPLRLLGWLPLVALLVVLPGLACDRPKTSGPAQDAESRWSLLAVGDTGQPDPQLELFEGQLAVADAMTREAVRAPVDALVLLGDNFYDSGLLASELVPRLRTNVVRPYCHFLALTGPRSAELESACPIPVPSRRPVPILAVLGNHDLESPESPRLQRHVVPEFLPGWTMSEHLVRVVELHPGISVVLFESEVAIDDRPALRAALVAALRQTKGPWRILATHRPVATDEYGHPPVGGYPMWVRKAIAEAGLPVQLVLSGHHHDLEAYAVRSPTSLLQVAVGSGSRARSEPVPEHPDLLFAALELGFARVDLVARPPGDRLLVSIFSVAPWPVLAQMSDYRVRARFEVDRSGRVVSVRVTDAPDPAPDA